jgi:hypothetical protein
MPSKKRKRDDDIDDDCSFDMNIPVFAFDEDTPPRRPGEVRLLSVDFGMKNCSVGLFSVLIDPKTREFDFTIHQLEVFAVCSTSLNVMQCVRMFYETWRKAFKTTKPDVDHVVLERQAIQNSFTTAAAHSWISLFMDLYGSEAMVHDIYAGHKVSFFRSVVPRDIGIKYAATNYASSYTANKAIAREGMRFLLGTKTKHEAWAARYKKWNKKDDAADCAGNGFALVAYGLHETDPHQEVIEINRQYFSGEITDPQRLEKKGRRRRKKKKSTKDQKKKGLPAMRRKNKKRKIS